MVTPSTQSDFSWDHFLSALESALTLRDLETLRVQWLGKSGLLTAALKTLGSLPVTERAEQGAALNALKGQIGAAIEEKQQALDAKALSEQLVQETLDIFLPSRPEPEGGLHPLLRTCEEIESYFAKRGFQLETGPEIETDFYNFTALNMPDHHPARQGFDTFYLQEAEGQEDTKRLLRTHTSPVQIRTLQSKGAPLRMIAMGRVYRCDHDATHTPMFHQVEGLVIEPGIHMEHLKGCLSDFLKDFFQVSQLPVRFRPSFFPFTEPSAEVDIGWDKKTGKIGQGSDWLEILGAGMIHPHVLKAGGLDPDKHQGFAFGMGIERLTMLKYGMADLRPFFESDSRWLRHYRFFPWSGRA